MITAEVHHFAQRATLCWLATVDEYGQPSVSPKEIFCTVDELYVLIANLASPTSVRNIERCPSVCVSFIDIFIQKGFKISGIARNIKRTNADYAQWVQPLAAKAGPRFTIHSVIQILASSVEPIVAPSYRFFPHETTEESQISAAMRAYGVRPLDAPERG